MPGARPVAAEDLLAQLRAFGPAERDDAQLVTAAAAGRTFTSLSAFRRACPPECLEISPGAWDALFAPLFGEFE